MAWSFHCFDAATSAPLGTVEVESWQSEDRLNDSGSWSATLAAPATVPLARAALVATMPARSVVVAVRTNIYGLPDPVYTGYIPPGGRRIPDIVGGNLLSYFDHRELDDPVPYAAVDQFTLVADLIARTQATGRGVNIDLSQVGTSGVLRDQTWFAYERKNIGEAIRQKAAIIDGFDFDIRTELDAGALVRRLRCWHPRRGRAVSNGGPVFTHGGNVAAAPTVVADSRFVTETTALGAEIDEVTREREIDDARCDRARNREIGRGFVDRGAAGE